MEPIYKSEVAYCRGPKYLRRERNRMIVEGYLAYADMPMKTISVLLAVGAAAAPILVSQLSA